MTDSSDGRACVLLTLSFEPLAEQIASLRSAVSDLCAPHIAAADELSRLLLATHELLENIVKYSAGGAAEFHLALERAERGLLLRLRTKNRALPERLRDTRQRLDALAAAPDPLAHYDEMIRESAGRHEGSGLGLARILAESEMTLRYQIEREELTIIAEALISERGQP
ncbi:MAG TPA: ATP-binding protein [Polyangiaceae bacterium]